jgi:hypothetical protein
MPVASDRPPDRRGGSSQSVRGPQGRCPRVRARCIGPQLLGEWCQLVEVFAAAVGERVPDVVDVVLRRMPAGELGQLLGQVLLDSRDQDHRSVQLHEVTVPVSR